MFKIKVEHRPDEVFAWSFNGNNGDDIFGVQVEDKDKEEGLRMIERSLVLNDKFGLKDKKEMEEFMLWQNHGKDIDVEELMKQYTFNVINTEN